MQGEKRRREMLRWDPFFPSSSLLFKNPFALSLSLSLSLSTFKQLFNCSAFRFLSLSLFTTTFQAWGRKRNSMTVWWILFCFCFCWKVRSLFSLGYIILRSNLRLVLILIFFSFGGSSMSWMKKIFFFYIFSLKRDRFVIFVNFAVEMLNFDGILNVKIDFVVI